MILEQAIVRQIKCPLSTPYVVSSGNLDYFDPFVIQLIDSEGRSGWGECLIAPGYTHETIEGSWKAATLCARELIDQGVQHIDDIIQRYAQGFPGITSIIYSAVDMLKVDSPFHIKNAVAVPLLAPCQGHDEGEIREEVESLLEQGYRTLKVKVGFDWQADLNRVARIQRHLASRGTIRLDANRGFNLDDGCNFSKHLFPNDIELLEQPCAAHDWVANAQVAEVSTVPVMLDESIYGLSDIDRAATLTNVGFVKLKLKKMGSADLLQQGLQRIRSLGMTPVLGDGVSVDLGCWQEACIATTSIDNAGEMNGFLKTQFSIFENPIPFSNGMIHFPENYWPTVDVLCLQENTVREVRFS